jgi:prepilin-type N-terminal cleavage/methylation domain-containing protein/prepilin-type processing-associated H-X9-DG protein
MKKFQLARGFTLVELLVVIAIIGVLVALLLPAIQAAREAARRTQCANNEKNIGLALINYTDVKGRLPAATPKLGKMITDFTEKTGVGSTWVLEILPFIEMQNLYDQFDMTRSVTMNSRDRATPDMNGPLLGTPIPVLVCPSDDPSAFGGIGGGVFQAGVKCDGGTGGVYNRTDVPQMGLWYPVSSGPTIYDTRCPDCPTGLHSKCCQGNSFGTDPVDVDTDPVGGRGTRPSFAGLFGRWHIGIRLKEIGDGTSNVIMAGEQINGHCRYTCAHCPNFAFASTNININKMVHQPEYPQNFGPNGDIGDGGTGEGPYQEACGFKSQHPGGAQFMMADGSVHMVSDSIDYDLFARLGDRNSGAPKQLP